MNTRWKAKSIQFIWSSTFGRISFGSFHFQASGSKKMLPLCLNIFSLSNKPWLRKCSQCNAITTKMCFETRTGFELRLLLLSGSGPLQTRRDWSYISWANICPAYPLGCMLTTCSHTHSHVYVSHIGTLSHHCLWENMQLLPVMKSGNRLPPVC